MLDATRAMDALRSFASSVQGAIQGLGSSGRDDENPSRRSGRDAHQVAGPPSTSRLELPEIVFSAKDEKKLRYVWQKFADAKGNNKEEVRATARRDAGPPPTASLALPLPLLSS